MPASTILLYWLAAIAAVALAAAGIAIFHSYKTRDSNDNRHN